jgi:uncharacterized membrane protein YheB (UPF0754 family)
MTISDIIIATLAVLSALISLTVWVYNVHVTAKAACSEVDKLRAEDDKLRADLHALKKATEDEIQQIEKEVRTEFYASIEKKSLKIDKMLEDMTELKIAFSKIEGALNAISNQLNK